MKKAFSFGPRQKRLDVRLKEHDETPRARRPTVRYLPSGDLSPKRLFGYAQPARRLPEADELGRHPDTAAPWETAQSMGASPAAAMAGFQNTSVNP